jgi:hypothetical protein
MWLEQNDEWQLPRQRQCQQNNRGDEQHCRGEADRLRVR